MIAARVERSVFIAILLLALLAGSAVAVSATSADGVLFASCTASPTTAAVGETVTLDGSNSDARFLEFDKQGDGIYDRSDETDFIVNVTYSEEGTYEPVVRADQNSADTASCGTVTITNNEPPRASLSVSPNPATTGQQVTFDGADSVDSDGTISTYSWDFDGDGTVDRNTSDPTTTTTYDQSGFYSPALEVVDDDGATDFRSVDLEVQAADPVAACLVEPTTVRPDEEFFVDARNSENADFVAFDFDGDGQFEITESTTFLQQTSIPTTGTYTPIVRVSNGDQTSTTECSTVTVQDNIPPQPDLTATPNPAVVGETVTFDGSASSDPDGQVDEYRWDFDGDGDSDRTTTTETTDFAYSQADSFVPTLTVVDDEGATASASMDLEVQEQPADSRLVCSVSPTTVSPGETVRIDASESTNVEVIDYDLDGDGQFEEFERTTLTLTTSYDEPETYSPRVRVTGSDQIEDCGTVIVQAENRPPEPGLTISPNPSTVSQQLTFDASNAVDADGQIVTYSWDFDGDGQIDRNTSGPTTTTTVSQAGSYVGVVTVVDDDGAAASLSRDYSVEEPAAEPRAVCAVSPQTVTPGETVTIDARDSTGGGTVDYDLDGDGEYDVLERIEFVYETTYDEPGTYTPVVRLRGAAGSDIAECGTVVVEGQNEPPNAVFSVTPAGPLTGQQITFDASNASDPDGQIVQYQWDFDGDGTVDLQTADPETTHTYNDAGGLNVVLTVVDDDQATDSTTRDLFVEADRVPTTTATMTTTAPTPSEGDGEIPWVPIGLGAGGVAGLGGLVYYLLGGGAAGGVAGGSGGGDGKNKPKPKPKPKFGGDVTNRYETGVFEIPSSSGTLSVPVGFSPDLIFFDTTNGARTDTATDRTAGWSRGIARDGSGGLTNQCLTVADDAHSTDQATCASADEVALQIARHEDDDALGRVTGAVSKMTADGFEFDVSVPGDDPLAGGIRVHYQAFRTGNVETEVGHFEMPLEPGTQTVELGIEADHVSFVTSAAVTDTDHLWTTNCGVGLSAGNAVSHPEDGLSQTVWGGSAWPSRGHYTAGVCRDDRILHLLYQDGDSLAGRTSGRLAALDSEIRLRYDRVYNGPQKLGSTDRHVVSYLAMNGGETMRPAVGTFPLPRPNERQTVDCGFEPELVELTISDGPLGEEVTSGANPQPFGWSTGTAIDSGDGLRQYVLHHATVPDSLSSRVTTAASVAAEGAAATDGGEADTDTQTMPESGTLSVPAAAESPDDERVGIWLPRSPDGTVVGRDELRVEGMTDSGFQTAVDRISTDDMPVSETRPTVVYRAWPTTDGTSGGKQSRDTESRDETTDTNANTERTEAESA